MKNHILVAAASIVAAQLVIPDALAQSRQLANVKTPAEILQENTAALALIVSDGNITVSLGSGFFIEDGSALVTNFHVIEGGKDVYVKTGDGRVIKTDTLYVYDVKQDLAVLKVSPPAPRSVALGDSSQVVTGAPITVIGNPEGLEKSVTNGLVSGTRTIEGQRLFQISAPISHGSSGGPVFDDQGRVIGVVVSSLSDGQNLNFAIPVNEVSKLWGARHETNLASLPRVERSRPADLDGSWAATFADSLSSGQLSFTLVQDDINVRGTYTSSLGGGGTIKGKIADNKFSFELVQSIQGCPGHFTGNAELRSGSMVGTFAGADCQGTHTNGTFSMAKGTVPMQPAQSQPSSVAANSPIIEYGDASELRGVKKVFIYGVEPDVRKNMLQRFAKNPALQVVGRMEEADVVLVFGAQTFSMGTHTNVWTDAYGHTYGTTTPRYGINGQGSVVRFLPPNRIRVVWQFSATRTNVFQRRPSTNLVRDFIAAWEKANR